MTMNLPTYHQNAATVAVRAGEVPAASFSNGMNLGGSNTCGVGINTGNIDPKLELWSVNDQFGTAREPQNSQHIGGDALGLGDQSSSAIRVDQDPDFAESANYVVADQVAAPGAVYHVATQAVNRTGVTVQIGDRLWGPSS